MKKPTTEQEKLLELVETTLKFAQKYAKGIGEPKIISDNAYLTFIEEQTIQLEKSWNKNKFIICANLKKDTLENCIGIRSVMGWKTDITVAEYFHKIHVDYLSPYLSWSMAVYELSKELKGNLKPLEQVYQLQVPLLHENGKFYWCIMQGFPIRLDKSGNMTIHCNMYQRMEEMNEYNHRLFQPILIENLEIMEEWNKRLASKMKKSVLEPLNINEIRTIKLGLTKRKIDDIATALGVSRDTVMGYNKNILRRGREIGGKVFANASEVGQYFELMGWVTVNKE